MEEEVLDPVAVSSISHSSSLYHCNIHRKSHHIARFLVGFFENSDNFVDSGDFEVSIESVNSEYSEESIAFEEGLRGLVSLVG